MKAIAREERLAVRKSEGERRASWSNVTSAATEEQRARGFHRGTPWRLSRATTRTGCNVVTPVVETCDVVVVVSPSRRTLGIGMLAAYVLCNCEGWLDRSRRLKGTARRCSAFVLEVTIVTPQNQDSPLSLPLSLPASSLSLPSPPLGVALSASVPLVSSLRDRVV